LKIVTPFLKNFFLKPQNNSWFLCLLCNVKHQPPDLGQTFPDHFIWSFLGPQCTKQSVTQSLTHSPGFKILCSCPKYSCSTCTTISYYVRCGDIFFKYCSTTSHLVCWVPTVAWWVFWKKAIVLVLKISNHYFQSTEINVFKIKS
jgi:hypothetical protein